jgi:dimethylargininase
MLLAITRQVSTSMAQCELTHLDRQFIDVRRAREQHSQYESCLREMGCDIIQLPEEPNLPDSVFVEDTAIVLDEIAVILRPGADSRKTETRSVAEALKPYRELAFIDNPGTIDGGDVLKIDRTHYVGLSSRTNQAAIYQLKKILTPLNYEVKVVSVNGCLHLKTAVTQIGEDLLLLNPNWVEVNQFPEMRWIKVDPSEPFAANTVWIEPFVLYPSAFPKTAKRLEEARCQLKFVDASELAKAEGALTCCSLIFSSTKQK